MSAPWRKSSYSGNGGQDCVEVSRNSAILIRDTKDRTGVTLSVSREAWVKFTASVK